MRTNQVSLDAGNIITDAAAVAAIAVTAVAPCSDAVSDGPLFLIGADGHHVPYDLMSRDTRQRDGQRAIGDRLVADVW